MDIYRITIVETFFVFMNIHIILMKIFPGKLKRNIKNILIYTFFMVFGVLLFYFPDIINNRVLIFSMLCIVIPIISIKKIKIRDILFLSLFVSGIATGIVAMLSGILEIVGIEETVLYMSHIFVNCLILLACVFMSRNVTLKRKSQALLFASFRTKLLISSAVWLGFFFIYVLSVFIDNYQLSPLTILMASFSVLMFFVMGIMIPLLVISNISSLTYKSALADTNKQMDRQTKYYESIIAKNEELKKFKHDYSNLLIALKEYLVKSDTKGALRYLSELHSLPDPGHIAYETGSELLDVLLSDKQAAADKITTKIEFEGAFPEKFVTSKDVCIIFGNALDNAIEACERFPNALQKTIVVSCNYIKGFLFIKIKNPVLADIRIAHNSVQTTKTDGGFHGLGLLSIQDAVERYSGKIHLSCVDKIFSFEADLDFNTPRQMASTDSFTCI